METLDSFALFRLPHQQQLTLIGQIDGLPDALPSCAELSGHRGFVIAPFAPSVDHRVLVIRPDVVMHPTSVGALDTDRLVIHHQEDQSGKDFSREDYQLDFANFHAHLSNGDFRKLVLSRSIRVAQCPNPFQLFEEACRQYPRVMVTLVSTPQSGAWLVATPEILLSGTCGAWQTVALAGTMPFSNSVSWSDKNIQEQRFVATYITEVLEHFTDRFEEDGPHTVRAAHLAHLRSDFRFTLNHPEHIGELIQALHPTPAVCGIPKYEAQNFILHNEHHERGYYSGFMGPLDVEDQTNLYVTLRCLQFAADHCRLFAGGGILPESTELQEWQETETKLDTMRRIMAGG